MTQEVTPSQVEVTQADREVAAKWLNGHPQGFSAAELSLVQAFAARRALFEEQARTATELEVVASETRLELARQAIKDAYEAGCYAVHENCEPYRDPDFTEAASDYAADVEDVIAKISGARGECTVPPSGWRCTRAPGHEGPCAAHRALSEQKS